jgi:hypothetical protein
VFSDFRVSFHLEWNPPFIIEPVAHPVRAIPDEIITPTDANPVQFETKLRSKYF